MQRRKENAMLVRVNNRFICCILLYIFLSAFKGRHTPRNIATTWRADKLLVCVHTTHVTRKVRKLVHTKRIEELICAVAGTACLNSTHHVTLKIEVILSLLHEWHTSANHVHVSRAKCYSRNTENLHKNGNVKRGKLLLQFLPTSWPRKMSLMLV